MKQTILVAGGAGYIGSHAALALEKAGYDVLVLDNLSAGHAGFLRFGRHVIGDLADRAFLKDVFTTHAIDAVMHFAACINVGESVTNPAKFYRNNVSNALNLLECVVEHGVKAFLFSSTCAVYGVPQSMPLREDHPKNPISPYGRTKLAVEWMLEDFARAYGLKYGILRYFNASGAAPAEWGADIGEWHEPETHLIPLVLRGALEPGRVVRVFGTDYNTQDGTCVRDYIHVCDLADAHVLLLQKLLGGAESTALNLGNGTGFSVREIIDCAQRVTGREIAVEEGPRREGDPDCLIGDASRAVAELGWKPRMADIDVIMRTAWDWERRLQKLKGEQAR